jgi:O-antigen/teichoic acid export membrane protein
MNNNVQADTISRPALLLVGGRAAGLAASFAIGIVLARIFSPAEFGTYKQFFLVYATLYGLAQLGMAESLYYFVPRKSEQTGRYVCNAMVALALAGSACTALLYAGRASIAAWLTNAPLADHMLLLGLFLTFTLTSTVLEITMISRKRHRTAALTYAASDVGRTLLYILPALVFGSLRAVFVGATVFAALRLSMTVLSLWRQFGHDLRIDLPLLRQQLAYAVPFALAVGIEVVLINYHQYVVASRVDAAMFAIYAVGCLQIPLMDLVVTSTVSVLMVKMAEEASHGRAALVLWHETICRLAFLMFPLAVFLLVAAHNLIVGLFTATYAASVPIFMVWALTILPPVLAVDAVLRVYAQTRFLLVMNLVRFAFLAATVGWCLSTFGLPGAVVVTLLAMTLVKLLGVVRIAHLMHVHIWEALPWGRLAGIALRAAIAAAPVLWLQHTLVMPPLVGLFVGGVVYASTYGALSYAADRTTWASTPAVPTAAQAGTVAQAKPCALQVID